MLKSILKHNRNSILKVMALIFCIDILVCIAIPLMSREINGISDYLRTLKHKYLLLLWFVEGSFADMFLILSWSVTKEWLFIQKSKAYDSIRNIIYINKTELPNDDIIITMFMFKFSSIILFIIWSILLLF